jgi:hypothetical protein
LIDEWYVMDYNLYEDCETAIKNAWGWKSDKSKNNLRGLK